MKKVLIYLATPFVWIWNQLFGMKHSEPAKGHSYSYKSFKEEMNEEEAANNMILNNQEKAKSEGIDVFKEPATEYIEIENPNVEFEEKVSDSEVVKVEKSRRILTYKIETKARLVLYEGKKISKFIEESKLDLDFTQRQVYRHATKHQDGKLFKGKYYVSFTEE